MPNKFPYKKIVKSIVLLPVLFTMSCSTLLSLKRAGSDDLFLSLKPNNLPITYTVNSDLQDLINDNNILIPFNKAFRQNIDDYINARFNNVNQSGSGYKLAFQVKSLDIDYRYNPDLGAAFLQSLAKDRNPLYGQSVTDIRLVINLRITKDEQLVSEKNIITNTNVPKEVHKADADIQRRQGYEAALNDALNKSLILIDKYITSIGM